MKRRMSGGVNSISTLTSAPPSRCRPPNVTSWASPPSLISSISFTCAAADPGCRARRAQPAAARAVIRNAVVNSTLSECAYLPGRTRRKVNASRRRLPMGLRPLPFSRFSAGGFALACGIRRCGRERAMSVLAIGQKVRREEDLRLLTGRGRYVDDVPAIGPNGESPGRGHVLRSPHAHARIASLDAGRARAAPGVLAVLTGIDLRRPGLGTLRPLIPRRKKRGGPGLPRPQP